MNNILFVCSANKDRSKTAEDYFSEIYPDLNFKSSGTNLKLCHQLGTNPISEEDIEWADTIYVMEEKHKKFIISFAVEKSIKKIKVLSIPDKYKYYQKELIELLISKLLGVFL